MEEEFVYEDDDEGFDAGDTPIEDINWDEVAKVEDLFNKVEQHPADDDKNRSAEAFLALKEIYGDDLIVPGVTTEEL